MNEMLFGNRVFANAAESKQGHTRGLDLPSIAVIKTTAKSIHVGHTHGAKA